MDTVTDSTEELAFLPRPMPDRPRQSMSVNEWRTYDWCEGYNTCLEATGADNVRRERDALQAAFRETLTSPNIGLSEATARRIIDATLREARGEST